MLEVVVVAHMALIFLPLAVMAVAVRAVKKMVALLPQLLELLILAAAAAGVGLRLLRTQWLAHKAAPVS
jgi:hypothetical protein